jgi:hypothetical protein
MALKTDIRGMSHTYPDHFVVGREKVREYAKAVKVEDPASLGADIVVTRNICTDENGELVMEAFTTLMGQQGDNSAKVDFL